MSLIELLLALSGIMIIAILGIRQYQQYHHAEQITLIKQDEHTIFYAMNRYFHTNGCNSDGIFIGHFQPAINSDLQLASLAQGRPPLISHYSSQISRMNLTVKDNQKPYYQFSLTATLNPNIGLNQAQSYQKELGATNLSQERQQFKLVWTSLPSSSHSRNDHHYWIMDGARRLFKNLEIKSSALKTASCAQ